jgi:hypothetical protein
MSTTDRRMPGTSALSSHEWVEEDFQDVFRWVRKWKGNLEKFYGRGNVDEQSTYGYDREGRKFYRIVFSFGDMYHTNRDVIYVKHVYDHDHEEVGCETCIDRFLFANC